MQVGGARRFFAALGLVLGAALADAAISAAFARASGLYDFGQYGQVPGPYAAPGYPQVVPQPVVPAPPPPPSIPAPATAAQASPPLGTAPQGSRAASQPAGTGADISAKGPYVRIDLGYSTSDSLGGDFDHDVGSTASIDLGLGYRFSQYFRFDGTLGYRGGYDAKFNGGKVEVQSVLTMLTIYWDLFQVGGFSPYLAAGMGLAYNNLDKIKTGAFNVGGDSSMNFAWSVGGGMSYQINQTMSLDLGYRYVDAGRVRSDHDGDASLFGGNDDRLKGNLRTHDFLIGLRNQF